jgi:hypothetical protein
MKIMELYHIKILNFFINDYSVTFYSPQMKDLQQKVEQLENIRKEAIKYVQEKADYPISYYHCLNDLLNILNKGDNNGK